MKKAGRPTKAEEFRTFDMGKAAIIKTFGSEKDFWEMIAGKAAGSKDHLKLLIEYTYGKAPMKIDVDTNIQSFTVPEYFNELDKGG